MLSYMEASTANLESWSKVSIRVDRLEQAQP
jgi:hypothetical protein